MNTSFTDDFNNLPLVDDDPQDIVRDDSETDQFHVGKIRKNRSIESINSNITSQSSSSNSNHISNGLLNFDNDLSPDEQEEKARLISQILELQNTLDDLSQRVENVKEENLKLRTENQVLGQYIENLMSASSVFQSTSPKIKKK